MKISIVCSSRDHPVNAWIDDWKAGRQEDVEIVRRPGDLAGGDFLFLVSCSDFVSAVVREKYRYCLVLHASDLPRGRGWSPHIWAVIEGRSEFTLSLLSAEDKIDSGPIWKQERVALAGSETFDEINALLFAAEIRMMTWAVENCDLCEPVQQSGFATYYPRRNPDHSMVRPDQTIEEVFDLLRVCDPERYPAFFYHRGEKYVIDFRKAERAVAAA